MCPLYWIKKKEIKLVFGGIVKSYLLVPFNIVFNFFLSEIDVSFKHDIVLQTEYSEVLLQVREWESLGVGSLQCSLCYLFTARNAEILKLMMSLSRYLWLIITTE